MKRRLARALVVFVAVWPAVTLVLQRTCAVDPWKLMSFGMYSVPPRRASDRASVRAVTLGTLSGETAEWPQLDAETARVRIVRVSE